MFYYSPVLIKKYKTDQSKQQFLTALRHNTREPFYDGINDRRSEEEDDRMFANEFENFIFLKNVISSRGSVPKTLLYIRDKGSYIFINTISYNGGIGGLILLLIFILGPFFGFYQLITTGEMYFLLFFLMFSIFVAISNAKEFRRHHTMIQKVISSSGEE